MEPWFERRILILGMTYPAYSTKYVENVCVGGIEEQSHKMVRIHPVPLRYLEPSKRFKSFQWIRALVCKHPSDPRPESLRIHDETIVPEEVIPAKDVAKRRSILDKCTHNFASVEALRDKWDVDKTSLGIVRPRRITGVRILPKTSAEREDWRRRERAQLAQSNIFDRPPKPLDFPEAYFLVGWMCNDTRCTGHEMSLSQWGIHELFRKLRNDPKREVKTIEQMHKVLDSSLRDIYLFLGNYRGTMCNFGLMDSYSAPRSIASIQGDLFKR